MGIVKVDKLTGLEAYQMAMLQSFYMVDVDPGDVNSCKADERAVVRSLEKNNQC